MFQYFCIRISFFAHDGCTDLAKSYAMPPAGTRQYETLGNTNAYIFFVYHKGGTVQMGFR